MTDEAVMRIREQTAARDLRFTLHAHQEMVKESMEPADILEALLHAELLEDYPEDRRGPSCLVLGYTRGGRPDPRRLHDGSAGPDRDHGLRTAATLVAETDREEARRMSCSIKGCPGSYEGRTITQTLRHRGQVVVIDHVPAEVCSVCGDTLLSPDTVDHIQVILRSQVTPRSTAPLYEYA